MQLLCVYNTSDFLVTKRFFPGIIFCHYQLMSCTLINVQLYMINYQLQNRVKLFNRADRQLILENTYSTSERYVN